MSPLDLSPQNPTSDAALFRKLYRSNLVLHLFFMLFSVAIIAFSFLMTCEGQTTVRVPVVSIQMPETCLSRQFWGLDCPGCGLTRSFISMSQGELGRAFSFNAAGPIVYAFVLVQIPWHLFQAIRIVNLKRPIESIWLFSGLYLICFVTFLQWFCRLLTGGLN